MPQCEVILLTHYTNLISIPCRYLWGQTGNCNTGKVAVS